MAGAGGGSSSGDDGGLVGDDGRAGRGQEDLQLEGGGQGGGSQGEAAQGEVEGVVEGVAEDGEGEAGAGGAIGLEGTQLAAGFDDQQGVPGEGGLGLNWEAGEDAGAGLQGDVEVKGGLLDAIQQVEAQLELVGGGAQVDGEQVEGGGGGIGGVEQAQVGVAPGGEDGGRRGRLEGAGGQEQAEQQQAGEEAGGHSEMIPWEIEDCRSVI